MPISPVRLASVTLLSFALIGLSQAGVQSTRAQADNSPPAAVQDGYVLNEDANFHAPAASGVLANDSDPDGDSLAAKLVTLPAHSQVFQLNPDGSFTYAPRANYFGPDSFEYFAFDGRAQSLAALVALQVQAVQDAPTAEDLTVDVPEDTPITITLEGSDADGDPLTYHVDPLPTKGSLTGSGNTRLYTPGKDFSGTDSFQYTVHDGTSQSAPATVTINVQPLPDAPTNISLDKNSVNENQPAGSRVGHLSTTDPDDPAGAGVYTYALVDTETYPDNSLFTIDLGKLVTATIFDFEACETSPCYKRIRISTTDGDGLSFAKEFLIEIKDVNEAPTALSDPYNMVYGQTLTEPAPGVLGNDSDPDGDPLTAELVTPPSHSKSFQLRPDGSFTYQPANGWTGEDSFTYTAKDEGGLTSIPTEVVITVSDKTKPQVSWEKPKLDGEVKDILEHQNLNLEVNATDDVGVTRVRFYRWVPMPKPDNPQYGEYRDIANLNGAPYSAELDTKILVQDWNQIFVKAYDGSGNESGRTWIWLLNKVPNLIFLPVLSR